MAASHFPAVTRTLITMRRSSLERSKYQLCEALSPEEYTMLEKDILERGIQVPIEVDAEGNVLDGHHRHKKFADGVSAGATS